MDQVKCIGNITCIAEHHDGRKEVILSHHNKVVLQGRVNMAKMLSNKFGGTFDLFVSSMTFGSGGTVVGTPRFVDDTRQGLFGPTVITKGVISSIDPNFPNIVTFTSVVTFDEGVGQVFNEMGLLLHNGDLYSMSTFGDMAKTSSQQWTVNWEAAWV